VFVCAVDQKPTLVVVFICGWLVGGWVSDICVTRLCGNRMRFVETCTQRSADGIVFQRQQFSSLNVSLVCVLVTTPFGKLKKPMTSFSDS